MEKRTAGIIATVVTVFLCGCPGIFAFCFGAIAAFASFVPGSNIDIMGSNDPQTALTTGIGSVCVGILFIAIPILVGVFTLRKKPNGVVYPGEPLPPVS